MVSEYILVLTWETLFMSYVLYEGSYQLPYLFSEIQLDLDGVCELRDKCKGAKLFHWKTSIPFPADLNKKVVKI